MSNALQYICDSEWQEEKKQAAEVMFYI
jgi:hypothetical protein